MAEIVPPADGSPYCGHCGYSFAGLTESTRCPECGRPIVEVLMRPMFPGKRIIRYRSKASFMGLPLVCVACGRRPGEPWPRAVGIIAVGEIATGVIACGLFARGVLAVGTCSIGLIAFGSVAVGGFAAGGMAIGGVACGGMVIGAVAVGGYAVGIFQAIGGFTYRLRF